MSHSVNRILQSGESIDANLQIPKVVVYYICKVCEEFEPAGSRMTSILRITLSTLRA